MSPKYNLISPQKGIYLDENDHASSACKWTCQNNLKHNGKTTRQQTGTPYPWYNSYGCSIKKDPKETAIHKYTPLKRVCAKRYSNGIPKHVPQHMENHSLPNSKNKNLKAKNPCSIPFSVYTLSGPKNRLSASFFRICTQQLPTQISSFGQSWPWMFCPISCVCLMVDRVSMVTFCALGGISLQEWLCPKL